MLRKQATYTRVKLVSSFALRRCVPVLHKLPKFDPAMVVAGATPLPTNVNGDDSSADDNGNNEDVTIVRKKAKVNNDVPPQGSNMQQQQQQRRSTSKIMKKELTKQHQDHQQKFDDIKCLALLTSTTLLATST